MTLRGARCDLGAPGLHQRDRLAGRTRAFGRQRETSEILDAFHIQSESADTLIRAQHFDQVLDREPGLVADREQVTDRQRTTVEGESQPDRATLADQCDPALERFADDLVRQQCTAIEEIDDAVAVGAEEGHGRSGFDQRFGQRASGIRAEL